MGSLLLKLNKTEAEKLIIFCFGELFNESSKLISSHGYKIYLQLLIKQSPYLVMNNINKVILEKKTIILQKI